MQWGRVEGVGEVEASAEDALLAMPVWWDWRDSKMGGESSETKDEPVRRSCLYHWLWHPE